MTNYRESREVDLSALTPGGRKVEVFASLAERLGIPCSGSGVADETVLAVEDEFEQYINSSPSTQDPLVYWAVRPIPLSSVPHGS